MSIKAIVDELNESNGANYKMDTLRKYPDDLLKRVLALTYDRVRYTYGITMKNIPEYSPKLKDPQPLEWALDILEDRLVTRETTGNDAIDLIQLTLEELSPDDSFIFEKILDRDLKINMGRSNINKVFKGLIVKPVYQRCGVFNFDHQKNGKLKKGTHHKINYPAILNLKADGTYREVHVTESGVEFHSRSGEEYEYPLLEKDFKFIQKVMPGRYFGELTVVLNADSYKEAIAKIKLIDPDIADEVYKAYKRGKRALPRAIGNGMINSDDIPHDMIQMDVWEFVIEEEYQNAINKVKNTSKYVDRFDVLTELVKTLDRVHLIESVEVRNYQEAIQKVSYWMKHGLEGGVLKNKNMVFRDGTNPEQLKMKLEIDAEVRCTGFYPGKKGTSREKTFGGITYENDEGTIRGRTSGFTDKQLKEFNTMRTELTGKVFTIQFNDLTRSRGSDTWALSHPRFIEFRDDKNETDTLEKVQELKAMAMAISSYVINYDEKADVLYITQDGLKATKSTQDENFIVVRRNGSVLCGLTIDGYQNRVQEGNWDNQFILDYMPDFDLTKLSQIKG